jgi:hypothetical protein
MPHIALWGRCNDFVNIVTENTALFTAGVTLICDCRSVEELHNFIARAEAIKTLVTGCSVDKFLVRALSPGVLPSFPFAGLKNLQWEVHPGSGEVFLQLVQMNPHLVDISIFGEQLPAEYVAGIVYCGRMLTKLRVHCAILTDAQATAIAQAFTALTHLTLVDQQPGLTDIGVEAFALHCTRLQVISLRVTAVTTASLVSLISRCSALQSMGVSSPYSVDDSVLMALGRCHQCSNSGTVTRLKSEDCQFSAELRYLTSFAEQTSAAWQVTSLLAVRSATAWLSKVRELRLLLNETSEPSFAVAGTPTARRSTETGGSDFSCYAVGGGRGLPSADRHLHRNGSGVRRNRSGSRAGVRLSR